MCIQLGDLFLSNTQSLYPHGENAFYRKMSMPLGQILLLLFNGRKLLEFDLLHLIDMSKSAKYELVFVGILILCLIYAQS